MVSSDRHEFTWSFESNDYGMDISIKNKPKLWSTPPIKSLERKHMLWDPGFPFHRYAPLTANWHILNVQYSRLRASSYEPGWPGWPAYRDEFRLGFIWENSARFPRWEKAEDPGDEFWREIRKTKQRWRNATEPGHPLIWTHRKSTGLIWRDPKFARPHWISYQKSIPFVCAQISGIATGQTLQLLKKREIIAFFLFFKSESVYYLSRGEVKNAPWRENLDFPQLCFQQISELFPPRQFWRDLLLLDLSKGFLSELAQRCIERFVIFKRLGFHRKRVIIELCLDCVKQTTCFCSHKGWQQNSNRPHSQWYVGHLSHITPYPYYLSCAPCILLEQDNTTTSSR